MSFFINNNIEWNIWEQNKIVVIKFYLTGLLDYWISVWSKIAHLEKWYIIWQKFNGDDELLDLNRIELENLHIINGNFNITISNSYKLVEKITNYDIERRILLSSLDLDISLLNEGFLERIFKLPEPIPPEILEKEDWGNAEPTLCKILNVSSASLLFYDASLVEIHSRNNNVSEVGKLFLEQARLENLSPVKIEY